MFDVASFGRCSLHDSMDSKTLPEFRLNNETHNATPTNHSLLATPYPSAGKDAESKVYRQPISTSTPQSDTNGLHAQPIARGSQTSLSTNRPAPGLSPSSPSIPHIKVEEESVSTLGGGEKTWPHAEQASQNLHHVDGKETFHGITLNIPTKGLSEDIPTSALDFSNRGSMLLDGRKMNPKLSPKLCSVSDAQREAAQRPQTPRQAFRFPDRAPVKVLSAEEETLSEKVRSFYSLGSDQPDNTDGRSSLANRMGLRWQDTVNATDGGSLMTMSRATSTTDIHSDNSASHSTADRQAPIIPREEHELAGGLEDWQNVDNADVDRYGFIIAKPSSTQSSGLGRSPTSRDPQRLQRVSTSLQIASETPRRRHTLRRTPSGPQEQVRSRGASRSSTKRPSSSQSAPAMPRQSTFRNASNKLPQNKDRKVVDEASDMFTLPRTATTIVEDGQIISDNPYARRKEIQREEKWRKMARTVPTGSKGGGMMFEFDTSSSKLIERTWKGVPDKWRATAWHAFLSASAKKQVGSLSDDELERAFHAYQLQSSPDDVQIDIDVPRTISSHIMFRRRYRGGQRLLFRVLHAMSLHFAETGYVQGMAALAATLLAYYEEERAFVMLVRMWDLRGLDKLYKSGFGGLMNALDDFEKHWLGEGELGNKLVSQNAHF